MNKTVIWFFVIIFELVGNYLPILFGGSIFDAWSILGGVIGGLIGVWVGVIVSKRFF